MGTGNYHPKTARFYDDIGLLSANRVLGNDLMTLFNQLSGLATESEYQRILVAPKYLRSELVRRIQREKHNHLAGKPSYIKWKINSLLDEELISELYEAAKAGVKIDIVVRGICAMRMSKVESFGNVRIRSILGRFLEHSRIFAFQNENEPEFFIGSADIMDRNLNRRIETLVQITEEDHKQELSHILDSSFNNEFTHWELDPNDKWQHVASTSEGKKSKDFQSYFLERLTK
jgi:polyphosphate kinase